MWDKLGALPTQLFDSGAIGWPIAILDAWPIVSVRPRHGGKTSRSVNESWLPRRYTTNNRRKDANADLSGVNDLCALCMRRGRIRTNDLPTSSWRIVMRGLYRYQNFRSIIQDATLSLRWRHDAPNIWMPWKLYVNAKSADDCARISTLQSYHYSALKLFLKYSIRCDHGT